MMITRPSAPAAGENIELAIVAQGTACMALPELADVRRRSIEKFAVLRPQLLKHSDEQTLASLVALSQAVDDFPLARDFSRWAVVSSSRHLGRAAFAGVVEKYRVDGPWGVSVQVIPNATPHAIASTISLALDSHGPCAGAGTGADDEAHALCAAANLLQDAECPGAWIAFTAWSPESAFDGTARPGSEAVCLAVVLAVVNCREARALSARAIGRIEVGLPRTIRTPSMPAAPEKPASLGLTEYLVAHAGQGERLCLTSGGIRIAIDWTGMSAATSHRRGTAAHDGSFDSRHSMEPRAVPTAFPIR
ncbi:MAG TPA: hypothetical protein VND64_05720 [Pirellulales bacterium]|nr:hypothetical protein [Pirellulales bacterium]